VAHFYGTLRGARGEATRAGRKGSGLRAYVASWQGAVRAELYHQDGVDYAVVSLVPWHGAGVARELYHGPVGGPAKEPAAAVEVPAGQQVSS
jgi:hypothetical protein